MVDNYEFRITLWEQKICLLKKIEALLQRLGDG